MPAGPNVSGEAAGALEGAALAIWTTTPWTIPANLAVAVNAELQYAVVDLEVGSGGWGGGLGGPRISGLASGCGFECLRGVPAQRLHLP